MKPRRHEGHGEKKKYKEPRRHEEHGEKKDNKVYDSYGGTYYQMGELGNALVWYEKSKTLDEKARNRYGYSITCGNIGRVFLLKGDMQQAEKYFLEDLKISEELQNNFGIAKMYENLGHVCTQNGQMKETGQVLPEKPGDLGNNRRPGKSGQYVQGTRRPGFTDAATGRCAGAMR